MKISDLPVLNDAKGNAYIPVVDPDETDPALRNKRIYLSTIAASVENFTPYDPAQEYSRNKPDFVSYSGNVYEYIAVTPSTGNLPTNTSYWKIVSAGQFNHVRNTDTGTNADSFFIGNPQGQDQEGYRLLGFQVNAAGRKVAFGLHFDESVTPAVYEIKICYNYTGTGSDVWEDIGKTTDASELITGLLHDDRLSENIPRLDGYNEFTNAIAIIFEPTDTLDNCRFFIYTNGETADRLTLNKEGKFEWSGGVTPDPLATLYRQSIGRMATDGKFNAVEGLQHKGADLLDHKTGTVIDFRAMTTHFGSLAIPETGNYTADLTGAAIGHVAFGFHNSPTEPDFSTPGVTFNKIGTKAYAGGQTNRVLFHYVGSNTIDYKIL